MALHFKDERVAQRENDGIRGERSRDSRREHGRIRAVRQRKGVDLCGPAGAASLRSLTHLLIAGRPGSQVVAGTNCVTASMRFQKLLPQGCPAAALEGGGGGSWQGITAGHAAHPTVIQRDLLRIVPVGPNDGDGREARGGERKRRAAVLEQHAALPRAVARQLQPRSGAHLRDAAAEEEGGAVLRYRGERDRAGRAPGRSRCATVARARQSTPGAGACGRGARERRRCRRR